MENKKVLGKILPAVLVLVLALLLVITISSCSRNKKTPVGEIVDEKNYLKIDLANNETYAVSKLDFYNKLRYVGYDVFEDALYEAVLKDYVDPIKKDIEDNSADLENGAYFKKFKYIIDNAVYGTTKQNEIDNLDEADKLQKENAYLNQIKKAGYDVDYAKGVYQKSSLEYQTLTLAKREFARKALLDEIDEDDSENQITKKKVTDYFTNNIVNKSELAALVIFLSSQTEINDTLEQLNLKYIGNKLYRVIPTDSIYEDPAYPKFSEYDKFYDDFDTTDGIAALDDNEVLFEFCRVYNYVYSYKNTNIKLEINSVDYLDTTAHPYNPLVNTYTDADYIAIKNYKLEDMVSQLLSQDKGDLKTSPRLIYDYDTVYEIDSTLYTALNTKYLYDSKEYPRYNTPSSTYARGNYLTFKLKDGYHLEYLGVEALANLMDSIDNNESTAAIKSNLESVKEEYADLLNGLGIFADDEKVKAWAVVYANEIEFDGIKGAQAIMASTKDKEDENSIWNKIFEEMLTNDYINTVLTDFIEDNCKITIYDQLFEVQFAQNNAFYKAGSKTSKENVLKVKITDPDTKEVKENTITAADMFDRLNQKYGAREAIITLSNQILKEKYYSKITKEKLDEYEDEYDSIIAFFAQGNSTQYGYNPSIGQKAFVNLYFRADNKDEAIFNMWVATELQKTLIYDNPKTINESLLDYFQTLSNLEYENYAKIEYNLLYVYTDDDEDGKPDDWTIVDDSDARKQEVKELAAKLINIVNERAMSEYSNSNRESAYNGIHSKYQSASRISQLGDAYNGDPLPTFDTTAEQDAYYFAYFKSKGIFLGENISISIAAISELDDLKDDSYEAQVKAMYDYMIANHSADLSVDQVIAREMTAGDSGANIDKATSTNLFEYKNGFGTFYVVNTTKAESYKFEEKDNSTTSTGSKVYPYSVDETDPFPTDTDEEGKKVPKDMTDDPNTLYNSTDLVSINQLIVYIRESDEGVESLSLEVVNAFKAYFENLVMDKYTSESFRFYILNTLINNEAARITINEDLKKDMDNYANTLNEALFNFNDTELSEKWYEIFK